MLSERQKNILRFIIENNIKTAQPVSSEVLANKLNVSSATVRNEMSALTEMNFLEQPHTSAGRIPSEFGWQFFVKNMMASNKKLPSKLISELDELKSASENQREYNKMLAKKIVDVADAAVMVAFGPRDIFYTGLTNLFRHPEFQQLQSIFHITQVIDHLDEVMVELFHDIDGIDIKIGKDNPFSDRCSLMVTDFSYDDNKGVFGIMGPLRMDYEINKALLDYIVK